MAGSQCFKLAVKQSAYVAVLAVYTWQAFRASPHVWLPTTVHAVAGPQSSHLKVY